MTIHTFTYIAETSYELKALFQIEELLAEGGQVVGYTVYSHKDDVWERWAIRKDEKAAATPLLMNVQVRAVTGVECRETYSKSTQQYFKYWTCTLENGEKVNVFDHPDESRNTFKIMKAAGWHTWEGFAVGYSFEPNPPIPVTVSYDGEWYSLVNIIEWSNYIDVMIEVESPDDDIPFGSSSIDDYEFPENADGEDDENEDS